MSDAAFVHQMRAENCFAYLVTDTATRDAALVDPRADQVTHYLRELSERGAQLRLIVETHTHADHLSGAAELRARTGAEVLLSTRAVSDVATRRLRDGDRVALGKTTLDVLESPGHTDDSITLRVNGALLTGDALLIGGAGRTDFQNGSAEALYETFSKRFAPLPGNLVVYPAHDYAGRTHSTLAQERATNPLFRLTERNRFVAALHAVAQPKPPNMETIVTANVRGVRPASRMSIDELADALARPDAPLVVDVRLPAEYRAVHLAPSTLIPLDELGRRHSELPLDRELVLVCRTGARARLAAARLSGYRTRVLEGGLVAWQAAGRPVIEGKAHMSLERQVRIVAGALASMGGVLAVSVNPWFGLVPALIGAGLVYAGITDRCGMAMVLGKLPYNRDAAKAGSCAAPLPGGSCAAPIVDPSASREPQS
jgi:glyoxylase-like metal-dependent hydrolase (beta-lactamase superfamily II)/rhodanese-related sulfurtransferase